MDPPLEEDGFELVWGFSCQAIVSGLLSVLCSERESRSSSRRLRSGSRSARKGSRDRNGSQAWRLAASRRLCFRSALTPEHAEGGGTGDGPFFEAPASDGAVPGPFTRPRRFCTRPAFVHGAEMAESRGGTSGCLAR